MNGEEKQGIQLLNIFKILNFITTIVVAVTNKAS
jgi:hypothetical protein